MATPGVKGEADDEEQQTPDEEVDEETPDADEEDEVETEEVELPEDDGEDDEESSGGLLAGSTFGVSNKFLLGVGILAIVVVLALRSMDANSSTRTYENDEQVDEEIDEGTDGEVEQDVTDAGGSKGRFDEGTQEDAINSLFGEE